MPDEIILICLRADGPVTVEGATFDRKCSQCHQNVMVAPSGVARLSGNPDIKIVCNVCFRPEPTDQTETAGNLQDLLRELATAHWNRRRGTSN